MANLEWAQGNTDFTTGFGGTITSNDEANFGVGNDTVTGSLNQSTKDLLLLSASPQWTGNVGSPSAGALNIDVNQTATGIVQWGASAGTLYIGAASRTINKFRMTGFGSVYVQGGAVTTAEVQSGTFGVNDSTTTTTLYVYGGEVTYDDNSTGITTINVFGGTLNLKRGGTTVNMAGGTVRKYTAANATARAVTTINMWGGFLDYRSGSLTTLNANAGTVSFEHAQRTFTVTNLYHAPAVQLYLASRGPKVTITNQFQIAGGSSPLPRP